MKPFYLREPTREFEDLLELRARSVVGSCIAGTPVTFRYLGGEQGRQASLKAAINDQQYFKFVAVDKSAINMAYNHLLNYGWGSFKLSGGATHVFKNEENQTAATTLASAVCTFKTTYETYFIPFFEIGGPFERSWFVKVFMNKFLQERDEADGKPLSKLLINLSNKFGNWHVGNSYDF